MSIYVIKSSYNMRQFLAIEYQIMKCNRVIALFPMTHLNGVYVSLLCTNLALAHREIVIRCRGHHNILSSHILVMHTAQKVT